MTQYRMLLPDTDQRTFIKYITKLIDSKKFPYLKRYSINSEDRPVPTYPYLHWFVGDSYVYFGHRKDYMGLEYEDFAFNKMFLGEL